MEGFKISVNFLTSTKILTIIVFTLWPRGKRNKWRMDEGVDFFFGGGYFFGGWIFFWGDSFLGGRLFFRVTCERQKKICFGMLKYFVNFLASTKILTSIIFTLYRRGKSHLRVSKKKNIFDNSEHSENFVTSTKNSRVIIFTLYVGGKSCWWT